MSVTQHEQTQANTSAEELAALANKLGLTHKPHHFARNPAGELRELITFPFEKNGKVVVLVRSAEEPASVETVEALSIVPELLPVKSSRVAGIGYDAITETVKVRFINGTEYEYYHRPSSVWLEFQAAPSKGSFIAKILTPGKDYKRIK